MPSKDSAPVVREPVVAGIFYPAQKRPLAELIDQLLGRRAVKKKALAVLVPHGGYTVSGAVAGSVYSRVRCTRVAVVIGPSHTGKGKPLSVMTRGTWATPLGQLPVDAALAKAILKSAGDLESDAQAHQEEHSVEVQLPFLQRSGGVRSFVPVVLGAADVSQVRRIGQGIARAVRETGQEALLICSTDLTHYEPQQSAQAKDALAVQQIMALDEHGLLRTVEQHSISMCGVVSAAVVIAAAKELGASGATLVKYQTSAEMTGEFDSVVGFAGVVIQ